MSGFTRFAIALKRLNQLIYESEKLSNLIC